VTAPRVPAQPSAPPPPPAETKPELLGFGDMASPASFQASEQKPQEEFASFSSSSFHATSKSSSDPSFTDRPVIRAKNEDEESELSANVTDVAGEAEEKERAKPKGQSSFRLGKGAMVAAAALAACAVIGAPQAPWHSKVKVLWASGQRTVHAWLNPQVVTTAQAPASHEDFGRAGDEYKLPVAENIPDATTDPSQIRVTPVIDPTAKKNNDGSAASADQGATQPGTTQPGATPTDAGGANSGQSGQVSVTPVEAPPGSTGGPGAGQPASTNPQVNASSGPGSATAATPAPVTPHADAPAASSDNRQQPAPQKPAQVHPVSATTSPAIPSSLSTQIASMTPEASGNKAPEAALQSIEPVSVPEAAERTLLAEGPAIAYPDTAKGQQGTVVLQVMIGRDGTVQDAKFLQGSLAFARAAIDGVKLWKFKPYIMNGRPVSVQTSMTLSFTPGS
jgi:TonB family protein